MLTMIKLLLNVIVLHILDMTRPKKWFLRRTEENFVVLYNNDGPFSKPNAANSLGTICEVTIPPQSLRGKHGQDDAVMVCTVEHLKLLMMTI